MYLEIPEFTQKTTRHPKNGWTEFRKDRGTNIVSPTVKANGGGEVGVALSIYG
jgi:hypothetical protein